MENMTFFFYNKKHAITLVFTLPSFLNWVLLSLLVICFMTS